MSQEKFILYAFVLRSQENILHHKTSHVSKPCVIYSKIAKIFGEKRKYLRFPCGGRKNILTV